MSDVGMHLKTKTRSHSVAVRAARGQAARKQTPRRQLGSWEPAAQRPDPVQMLLDQEASRVPELLPIRHARMAVSPFAFYRGTAALMAYDLGTWPHSGLVSQLCGDAHLSNFGLFGSPDRSIVFDLNDFDETHPGPFEWDVARMVTSFLIAARDKGLTVGQQERMALRAAQAYRASMAAYAPMNDLDIFYDRVDAQLLMDLAAQRSGKSGARAMDRTLRKASTRDRWSAISKVTEQTDDGRRFIDNPPLLARVPIDGAAWRVVTHLIDEYRSTLSEDRRELLRRYRPIDLGHKVVGVGSVGLRAFVLLMQGRDDDDLLVLQVKEAVHSVLEPYTERSRFSDQGHRVVAGQRIMQAASDVFLGWITGPGGRHFYVRQLRDMKWSPDIAAITPTELTGYAELCGRALARAHARSGDPVTIAAYLGSGDSFDRSVLAFGKRYTDQVDADFTSFTAALQDGRLATSSDESSIVAHSLNNEAETFGRHADALPRQADPS